MATPQDPTSWLLCRGGLLIQWNLCIVATPQDPTSWLLYRGGLLIQWNLCILATPQDPTSWLLYRGGLLIQCNLCIVATPQDPTSWLLYRGGLLVQWNLCIVHGHPSGPNQLAAIQRWPAHTVEPVYSGHPSGLNQLSAIQRWVYVKAGLWTGLDSGLDHGLQYGLNSELIFEHCSCTSKPGLWPGSLAGSLLNVNGEVLGAGFMLSIKAFMLPSSSRGLVATKLKRKMACNSPSPALPLAYFFPYRYTC